MCVNFLQIHQKTDVIVLEQVLEGTIRRSIASAVLNVFYCQTNQKLTPGLFYSDFLLITNLISSVSCYLRNLSSSEFA